MAKKSYYPVTQKYIESVDEPHASAVVALEELSQQKELLEDKIGKVLRWCNAYPLDIFPEPDLMKSRQVLEAAGITLDAVSASNMRHVLNGIKQILEGQDDGS